MRKAARPSGGMDSSNPRRWRSKGLHHHGGGVWWLFVSLWIDLWCQKLIVCKKWYKNNLKMRLTALLFDPPRRAWTPSPFHGDVSAVFGASISVLNLALKWGQSIRMDEVPYSTKWVKYNTLLQATTHNTTHNTQQPTWATVSLSPSSFSLYCHRNILHGPRYWCRLSLWVCEWEEA